MISKNSKTMKIPTEFDDFIDKLSEQVSRELGILKNKSQTMRMMARDFEGKLIFKDKKWDFKIF